MRSKRYFGAPIRDAAVCFCGIVTLPLLAASCATPRPVSVQNSTVTPIPAVVATKLVETPYEVRGYRETANASIRHEPHVIFRSARVPVTAPDALATVPRTAYPPPSLSPLPVSAELAAEIATQKKVSEDLRALQSSIAEAESRMRDQYALLVRQSAEAQKVREQLEAERERVRSAARAATTPAPTGPKAGNTTEAKW
ncbi:MAG: hypothetical protein ABIZ04_02570 [Opitutus sp.]